CGVTAPDRKLPATAIASVGNGQRRGGVFGRGGFDFGAEGGAGRAGTGAGSGGDGSQPFTGAARARKRTRAGASARSAAGAGQDPRGGQSRLRRQSRQPVLLLQDRAL